MKQSIFVACLVLLAAVGGSVHAEEAVVTEAEALAAGGSTVMTVTHIDQDTRTVTLRTEDGEDIVFIAGPEVRNLAQVEDGDQLTINYAETLAVDLYPVGGKKMRVESTEIASAPIGAKPQASISREVEITARVVALDRDARIVTLRGTQDTFTLLVADNVDLSAIEVESMVNAVYLEQIEIEVESP